VVEASEETCEVWEGCVSNDDAICLVERPSQLRVKFNTIQGKEIDLFCQGIIARVFLHEIDHLHGHNMWDESTTSPLKRRLVKTQPLADLQATKDYLAFLRENKAYILD
jgi:peptide deformylase